MVHHEGRVFALCPTKISSSLQVLVDGKTMTKTSGISKKMMDVRATNTRHSFVGD